MIERTYDFTGGSSDRVTGADSLRGKISPAASGADPARTSSGTGFSDPGPSPDPHDTAFGDAKPNGPVAENIVGGGLTSFSDASFSPDLKPCDPHDTATSSGELDG